MLPRRKKAVKEEEVTPDPIHNNSADAWKERMKFERNRLRSFDPWWLNNYHLDGSVAQRLAKAGFFCYGAYPECFSCGLRKDPEFWKDGCNPEIFHSEESPKCKFLNGKSDNVPLGTETQNNLKSKNESSNVKPQENFKRKENNIKLFRIKSKKNTASKKPKSKENHEADAGKDNIQQAKQGPSGVETQGPGQPLPSVSSLNKRDKQNPNRDVTVSISCLSHFTLFTITTEWPIPGVLRVSTPYLPNFLYIQWDLHWVLNPLLNPPLEEMKL